MKEPTARHISTILLAAEAIAIFFILAPKLYQSLTNPLTAEIAFFESAHIWFIVVFIITGLLLLLGVYSKIIFYIILTVATFAAVCLFFTSLAGAGFVIYFILLALPVLFYVTVRFLNIAMRKNI